MAVLIEGISVVIRCRSVGEKLRGGVAEFMRSLPNKTLRSDGELACVSFMTPHDVRGYIEHLEKSGLTYRDTNGDPVDVLVVDQNKGLMVACDWADFGHADWNNDSQKPVAVCCAHPTQNSAVAAPDGWVYENSLTASHRFIERENIPSHLKFVRHENGIDVLVDKNTGQEYFVARSSVA